MYVLLDVTSSVPIRTFLDFQDPDPYKYSINKQKIEKNLDFNWFVTFLITSLLSLKTVANIPTVSNKDKNFIKKTYFVLVSRKPLAKRAGSGS